MQRETGFSGSKRSFSIVLIGVDSNLSSGVSADLL